jgi:PilZ domain-containing protein
MPQKLLEVLSLGHCSHEFSWPRRADDGEYYQVCLLCAVEYRYDWQSMRRTQRMDRTIRDTTNGSSRKKPVWLPRARRLKLHTVVRYHIRSEVSWYEGIIDNLSQSGVLIHGSHLLPKNALVEMRFEMPEEISGQKASLVLCQGKVIRCRETVEGASLAAAILNYRFLHEP